MSEEKDDLTLHSVNGVLLAYETLGLGQLTVCENPENKPEILRDLLIQKYKEILERQNEYWKGWGNKDHNIKPIPDFEKLSDKELFEGFLEVYGSAHSPGG